MFEYLGTILVDYDPGFDLLRYLTVRTIGGTVTALLISIVLGPYVINLLKKFQFEQHVRMHGPKSHYKKTGTPTMGGLLILLSLLISTLLWADLSNRYIWVVIFVTIAFGFVGFLDDYIKVKAKNSDGLSSKQKIILQTLFASIASAYLYFSAETSPETAFIVPFYKDLLISMSPFAFIFAATFVVVGSSNAVNLTDGLDGLATVPVMLVAISFTLISYVVGNTIFSEYLQLQYIPDVGEISIFCGSIVGSCLGFLWYNAPPAKIFMGDTGSLSLGGSLAAVAIIAKHEIVLAIVGGLFVLETVSVIIQVISFKLTGKRIFKMAPIHHHFEQKGWAESTIVIRFWIIAIILALVGLATLKLR